MPMRLSGALGLSTAIVLWGLAASVLSGVSVSAADSLPPRPSSPTQCVLQGIVVPCTVQTVEETGVHRIEIGTIDPRDWQFMESDLPVDATALHVELLNQTTYENALRYVTAQVYRLYRAQKAQQLAQIVAVRMIDYVRAKYGRELTPEQVIEAMVLEAGLPIINVPELHERDVTSAELIRLLRGLGTPP